MIDFALCMLWYFVGLPPGLQQQESSAAAEKPKLLQIGLGTKPFDVTRHSVELKRIVQGGVPRDAIPSLVDPKFVTAAEARRFMRNDDEILGLEENGVAKAYPLKILNYHEVVNDQIGGRPVAVTY